MRQITVNLPKNSYTLSIASGALEGLPEVIQAVTHGKVLVVTDNTVKALYGQRVMALLESVGIDSTILSLPAGEPTKSFDGLQRIYEALADGGYTRSDALIALGGGVIGDLVGYAAATWQRGMKLIQVPTTLLSQIDSSIGGKTAINTPWGKNLVGAFKQPNAVVIDTDVLSTLTNEDFASGMAEMIKTACLTYGVSMETIVEAGGRQGIVPMLPQLIADCCDFKRQIVEEDELDHGTRMLLNLGHTLAHALEPMGNWVRWTHGQAVSLGLVRILRCAEAEGLAEVGTAKRVKDVLDVYGLPTAWPDVEEVEVMAILKRDKKVAEGEITLSLVKTIGEPFLYTIGLEDVDNFFKGRGLV